jgi:LysM repeat protein
VVGLRLVNPRTSRELKRYGAPAAFLAAVTIAVILIKSGLDNGSNTATTVAATTHATTTAPKATTQVVITASTPTTTTETAGQYYEVQSGDTLGSIAVKYGTTVEDLVRLNPDVDPTALRVGQRIRVS